MIQNNDQMLVNIMQSEWLLLQSALTTLNKSVIKCKEIGIKNEYTFEEQESIDSLTSKFNRTSDLFTQKILRTTWMLLHEPFVPFIDMMNMCEKIGILGSSDQMISIRDMRNQIAHEYIPEAIRDMLPEVIEFTQQLYKNIELCRAFLEKRKWINPQL